jgi:hypothetical protein
MKIAVIFMAMLCFSCVTTPSPPNILYLMGEIQAGRMKADDVNRTYDDYYAARKEYEQSASYKATLVVATPLLLLGSAAGNMPYCGYRGYGYGCLPSKAVVNTFPTPGGGTSSTIKWYP